ncbi:MAG TPA: hypothetical protein VH764_00830 [Gemmatimonadales bacterium]|jgi:hypothetical protein
MRIADLGGAALLASIALTPPAVAQAPPDAAARTFELRPRDGMTPQFEAGYRRHLDWHVGAGDPWAWYMWQIADGERVGLFVDGTFGHAWADFDRSVRPAEDGADNARHVEPFVIRTGAQAWAAVPGLGGGAVDPEAAPLVVRIEYRLRPGSEAGFVQSLRRLRSTPTRVPAVFRLVSGGESPTYVLWIPASTWREVGASADVPGDQASATAIRRELWRFRPDLSICRRRASRCHRTLGERLSLD